MAERRSLTEGLKPPVPPIDPNREKDFVFGAKARGGAEVNGTPPAAVVARSPLSTRIRSDLGTALKRASLERQLNGIEPNSLCDILEAAIEPWLKTNGYLS
jgi:hypothetical protein